jgi:hypothetical protein
MTGFLPPLAGLLPRAPGAHAVARRARSETPAGPPFALPDPDALTPRADPGTKSRATAWLDSTTAVDGGAAGAGLAPLQLLPADDGVPAGGRRSRDPGDRGRLTNAPAPSAPVALPAPNPPTKSAAASPIVASANVSVMPPGPSADAPDAAESIVAAPDPIEAGGKAVQPKPQPRTDAQQPAMAPSLTTASPAGSPMPIAVRGAAATLAVPAGPGAARPTPQQAPSLMKPMVTPASRIGQAPPTPARAATAAADGAESATLPAGISRAATVAPTPAGSQIGPIWSEAAAPAEPEQAIPPLQEAPAPVATAAPPATQIRLSEAGTWGLDVLLVATDAPVAAGLRDQAQLLAESLVRLGTEVETIRIDLAGHSAEEEPAGQADHPADANGSATGGAGQPGWPPTPSQLSPGATAPKAEAEAPASADRGGQNGVAQQGRIDRYA